MATSRHGARRRKQLIEAAVAAAIVIDRVAVVAAFSSGLNNRVTAACRRAPVCALICRRTFSEDEQVRDLAQSILSDEFEKIVSWHFAGVELLLSRNYKYSIPITSSDAVDDLHIFRLWP